MSDEAFKRFCETKDIFEMMAAYAEMERDMMRRRERVQNGNTGKSPRKGEKGYGNQ